jgi:hypothetical protein
MSSGGVGGAASWYNVGTMDFEVIGDLIDVNDRRVNATA